jgi:hypothetical protein
MVAASSCRIYLLVGWDLTACGNIPGRVVYRPEQCIATPINWQAQNTTSQEPGGTAGHMHLARSPPPLTSGGTSECRCGGTQQASLSAPGGKCGSAGSWPVGAVADNTVQQMTGLGTDTCKDPRTVLFSSRMASGWCVCRYNLPPQALAQLSAAGRPFHMQALQCVGALLMIVAQY